MVFPADPKDWISALETAILMTRPAFLYQTKLEVLTFNSPIRLI